MELFVLVRKSVQMLFPQKIFQHCTIYSSVSFLSCGPFALINKPNHFFSIHTEYLNFMIWVIYFSVALVKLLKSNTRIHFSVITFKISSRNLLYLNLYGIEQGCPTLSDPEATLKKNALWRATFKIFLSNIITEF